MTPIQKLITFFVLIFALLFPFVAAAGTENLEEIYIVQKGDTLGAIAKYYGTTVARLAEANAIQNVDRIYSNQKIRIALPREHRVHVTYPLRKDAKNDAKPHTECSMTDAIAQFHYPESISRALTNAVENGQYTIDTDVHQTTPNERVYRAVDGDTTYEFIYPDQSEQTPRHAECDHGIKVIRSMIPKDEAKTPSHERPETKSTNADWSTGVQRDPAHEEDAAHYQVAVHKFLAKHLGAPYDLKQMEEVLLKAKYPLFIGSTDYGGVP